MWSTLRTSHLTLQVADCCQDLSYLTVTMRGRHWIEVGVTIMLLLSELVIGHLCKSSIVLLDGFHTLFMLLNTINTSILNHFYSESRREHPTASPSPQLCVDYRATRAQPLGVFISNLLFLSVNIIYLSELCSVVLEPAVVQRPLLLVATGAVSLTFKMFLLGLHWHRVQRGQRGQSELAADSHIEANHNALFEEEKAQAEQGGVCNNNNKPKGCKGSLHNVALTISNPNTVNLSEDVTELHSNGACGQQSNGQTPANVQPALEPKPVPHSLLPSWLHVCETLLTPFSVLVNGVVTLSISSMWLHNSKLHGLLVYFDPMLSLLAVVLLIAKAIPLVFRDGQLLVQCAPHHLSVEEVGQKIVDIPGVEAMHELHVWKLTESFIVASVHVQCCVSLQNRCADVMSEVTKVLQGVGVSCCTIQPEFTEQGTSGSQHCSLACGEACAGNMCCSHLEEQHKILTTGRIEEEPPLTCL